MKKLTLCFLALLLSAWVSSAQTIPAKITGSLNRHYAGWKQAPGSCDNRKWFLLGDFDGDGIMDYVVRIKTGKSARSMRLKLIVFFGVDGGEYPTTKILDEPYKSDLLRSSFSVIKKGTKIQLGEGDGPTITLENDAASQYICQTDAIKTLIFKDGAWKNIYDQ